jgi:hypothetical protein
MQELFAKIFCSFFAKFGSRNNGFEALTASPPPSFLRLAAQFASFPARAQAQRKRERSPVAQAASLSTRDFVQAQRKETACATGERSRLRCACARAGNDANCAAKRRKEGGGEAVRASNPLLRDPNFAKNEQKILAKSSCILIGLVVS